MASIEKRGDEWSVRWRYPPGRGGRQYRHGCPSLRTAKAVAAEVEDALARGRNWEPAAGAALPALRDLIDRFLRDLARTKRPGTVQRAHAALGPFLAWAGEGAAVDAMSRQRVADYDGYLVMRQSAAATRRASLWAIGRCWRWGWEHPDWRPHMLEPSMPERPEVVTREVVAPTWAMVDAVVLEAEAEAVRVPTRAWAGRLAMLLRGLGWRVSQCLALEPHDVRGQSIRLRPELGKTRWERRGRTVLMPPWLAEAISSWHVTSGPLVGRVVSRSHAAHVMGELWARTGAPPEVYAGRPDHAFRVAILSELRRQRVDIEATEHYVGHAPTGVRGHYVDPTTYPMHEVAAGIPCVHRAPSAEVVQLSRARSKRA